VKRDRNLITDRAVRPKLVVVLTPILHLFTGVRKRQKPMRVQALRPELAVERFNEAIVRWLAWPGKVQRHVIGIGSQVKISRDEFAAVVDSDRPRISDLAAGPFERLYYVFSAIGEPRIGSRAIARMRIHDGSFRPVASWS